MNGKDTDGSAIESRALDGDGAAATIEARAAEVAALPAEADVPSPCINVCRIDPDSAVCAGCRRTLDEIAAWSRLGDAGKRIVWAQLARRAPTP